jgi:hypothetical protein
VRSDYYQPNLFFDAWSKGTHVKEPSGRPRTLYHGTMAETFTAFDLDVEAGNEENWYGKAIYLTSDPHDASKNYADREGPDLVNKLSTRSEQIGNWLDELWSEDEEEFRNQAEKYNIDEDDISSGDHYSKIEEYLENQWVRGAKVYPLYVRMSNPAIVSPSAPRDFYLDFDEESGEESGPAVDIYNAILKAYDAYGYNGYEMWSRISEGLDIDGFNYWDVEKKIRENYIEENITNVIKRFYQKMGHDGIILDAGATFDRMDYVGPGTQHYVVWNSNQVKSAIGNIGFYDTENTSILANKIRETIITAILLDSQGMHKEADGFDNEAKKIIASCNARPKMGI